MRFYERLGALLQGIRKQQGLTQAQLGDMVGLSRPSVANIERGVQPVSAETLVRLAAALGKPPSQLLPTLEDANSAETHREAMRVAAVPSSLIDLVISHLDEPRRDHNAPKTRTRGRGTPKATRS